MAVSVLMPLLIPLGEQITNVTHLTVVGNLAFSQPLYEVLVRENTAPVLLLTLHAATNSSSMAVMYSVVSGSVGGLFTVGTNTGYLTLTSPLDYENKNTYDIIVAGLAGEERAFVRVSVRVGDENDLAPTFPSSLLQTQITEEDHTHLPKLVLQVSARDGDARDEGRLLYSLSGDGVGGPDPYFSVTPTSGHLHLLRALDRDAPHGRPQWRLKVAATDGVHATQVNVHVNVKDINDNDPFFPNVTINATVLENTGAGSLVTMVEAVDYDDPQEGNNAVISYSVEKNVIDEFSGQPIFTIDALSGRILTALCCLDRERTPFYAIQVVASDGGGLKGTGTVVVSVGDENDVVPQFSRDEWRLRLHETIQPLDTVAFLTVNDPDITNDFGFRIVEGSGPGWDRFRVVGSKHGSGALQTLTPLDYEDPDQRRGFRFQVQVTDQVKELGWGESWEESTEVEEDRVASSWVVIEVLDDNDNAPHLPAPATNLTLPEDAPVGSSLATFTATDLDQGSAGEVRYTIDPSSDPYRLFAVDSLGEVRLRRRLDRERSAVHTVRVLAVDGGVPALTSTATLALTVTDVNDNAPNVANSNTLYVRENSPPHHVADLSLDDADDWNLGHGPPFTVSLDPRAPPDIKKSFSVRFHEGGDSGRGVAVVRSLVSLDREAGVTRLVPLVLSDSRSLTTTATITLTVADLNDNPMKPAAKTVKVTRIRDISGAVNVGRVYVEDPDDWDAGDKTWSWRPGLQHPHFSLDPHTGTLTMAPQAHDGTYELHFWVSDDRHRQRNVAANVTVTVGSVSSDTVSCAVPLTVSSPSPRSLITPIQEGGRTPLQGVEAAIKQVAGVGVRVVSLEAERVNQGRTTTTSSARQGWRLWLTSHSRRPLDQLLLLYRKKISEASGVEISEVGVNTCVRVAQEKTSSSTLSDGGVGGVVWVVDANRTALVTPLLLASEEGGRCRCLEPHPRLPPLHQTSSSSETRPSVAAVTHPVSCSPNPCLNGGRCILHQRRPRCVCPEGTSGSACKQLSRTFGGSGWAWAAAIQPCTRGHISLEFRTRRPQGLLLYAGPAGDLYPVGVDATPIQEDVMSVGLQGGRPEVLLDSGSGPVFLSGPHLPSLADNKWHRLDLIWGPQKVELVVDRCEGGGACRVAGPLPPQERALNVGAPLQVGGLAHPPPDPLLHAWPAAVTSTAFLGCIKNLRVNGEQRDLGSGVLGEDSTPGCPGQDPCTLLGEPCTHNARCVGVGGVWACECEAGWAGETCSHRTQPVFFARSSYVKMALSTVPPAHTTLLQLRFRTWARSGQLVWVGSQHGRDLAALHLINGRVCLQLLLHPAALTHLCLTQVTLADGEWHTVYVHRVGEWAEVSVDQGDGPLYNATPAPASPGGWSTPLLVDRQEGIYVGGSPEYVGVSLYIVHHDFHDGCLDDLRVSGVSLPLPPLANSTGLAQATMFTSVTPGCTAPPACSTNITCSTPYTCIDLWWRHECGCLEGSEVIREGGRCEDVDECQWSPCLNGGSCANASPGYFCHCPDSFIGQHCEAKALMDPGMSFVLASLLAAIAWIIITIVVVMVIVCVVHLRRRRQSKSSKVSGESGDSEEKTTCDSSRHSDDSRRDITELKIIAVTTEHSTLKKASNLAGVDVLRRDTTASGSKVVGKASGKGGGGGGCVCSPRLSPVDDLRNYAYEGDGSSPGSLSSCCSGGKNGGEFRLLGGFQEVSNLLTCLGSPSAKESISVSEGSGDGPSVGSTRLSSSYTHALATPLVSASNKSNNNSSLGTVKLNNIDKAKKNTNIIVSAADMLQAKTEGSNVNVDRDLSHMCVNKYGLIQGLREASVTLGDFCQEHNQQKYQCDKAFHNSLKRRRTYVAVTSSGAGMTGTLATTSCYSHIPVLTRSGELLLGMYDGYHSCHSCATSPCHCTCTSHKQRSTSRSTSMLIPLPHVKSTGISYVVRDAAEKGSKCIKPECHGKDEKPLNVPTNNGCSCSNSLTRKSDAKESKQSDPNYRFESLRK